MTAPVEIVGVDDIARALGLPQPFVLADEYRALSLSNWVMAADDQILRYVFRNVRPLRHLEFGTWLGDGVVRCVEECDATVWTVNALEGETLDDGTWAYASPEGKVPAGGGQWCEALETDAGRWVRTDAYGLIGRKYLNAGYGGRVCQVYADSRSWDTRTYPRGFFDTAFIDGGHAYDIVANDTRLAIDLVRGGGLVIWHDYCPDESVQAVCASTREVGRFIDAERDALGAVFDRLFWIEPSWLLIGVRGGKERPGRRSSS